MHAVLMWQLILTDLLLAAPNDPMLQALWARGVLPMALYAGVYA
jgi:hypothetical protein